MGLVRVARRSPWTVVASGKGMTPTILYCGPDNKEARRVKALAEDMFRITSLKVDVSVRHKGFTPKG